MRIAIVGLLVGLISFFASVTKADEATYRISFDGGWSLEPLPTGAHFSPLIGAVHSQTDEIFYAGGMASPGVERVAELGSTGVLAAEINQKIDAGLVRELVFRPGNVGPMLWLRWT